MIFFGGIFWWCFVSLRPVLRTSYMEKQPYKTPHNFIDLILLLLLLCPEKQDACIFREITFFKPRFLPHKHSNYTSHTHFIWIHYCLLVLAPQKEGIWIKSYYCHFVFMLHRLLSSVGLVPQAVLDICYLFVIHITCYSSTM